MKPILFTIVLASFFSAFKACFRTNRAVNQIERASNDVSQAPSYPERHYIDIKIKPNNKFILEGIINTPKELELQDYMIGYHDFLVEVPKPDSLSYLELDTIKGILYYKKQNKTYRKAQVNFVKPIEGNEWQTVYISGLLE